MFHSIFTYLHVYIYLFGQLFYVEWLRCRTAISWKRQSRVFLLWQVEKDQLFLWVKMKNVKKQVANKWKEYLCSEVGRRRMSGVTDLLLSSAMLSESRGCFPPPQPPLSVVHRSVRWIKGEGHSWRTRHRHGRKVVRLNQWFTTFSRSLDVEMKTGNSRSYMICAFHKLIYKCC